MFIKKDEKHLEGLNNPLTKHLTAQYNFVGLVPAIKM